MSLRGSVARILIIDDEEMVRCSLELILQTKGWQTELADGGVQGLAQARRSPPDLILCDLNMRQMNGLEVLSELRRDPLLKSVPVFIITGNEGQVIEEKALEQGAQAVILKPFDNAELFRLVEIHLNRRETSGNPELPDSRAGD